VLSDIEPESRGDIVPGGCDSVPLMMKRAIALFTLEAFKALNTLEV